MQPLSAASAGDRIIIGKISGSNEIRRHLASLGLVVETPIRVISVNQGDVIIVAKDTRLALSKSMADCIYY
jgi:ferrous iron transport protein A